MSQTPSSVKVVFLVIAATLLGGLLLAQDEEKKSASVFPSASAASCNPNLSAKAWLMRRKGILRLWKA